jgi:hypothetical protein
LEARLKVDALVVREESPYQAWLRPLFLDYEGIGEDLELEQLAAVINLDKRKGSWKRASARVKDLPILLSSNGTWNEVGELKGELHVDFPKFKMLKWDVGGTRQEPEVQPSSRMLRELAKKDPTFTIPSERSALDRLSFFKDFFTKERNKKTKDR